MSALRTLCTAALALAPVIASSILAADDPALEAEVDAYLQPLLDLDLISGSVLIARGDEILLAKGYGLANREHGIPNTPATKFRVGSMTKQFTAMAILVLAAKVIEVVSGQDYADFLRETIFDKLGMEDSGQDVFTKVLPNRATGYGNAEREIYNAPYRDMPFTSGAGSLYSTVLDLYKWDRALYANTLISEELLDRMMMPVNHDYAYGWFVREELGHKVVEHGGVACRGSRDRTQFLISRSLHPLGPSTPGQAHASRWRQSAIEDGVLVPDVPSYSPTEAERRRYVVTPLLSSWMPRASM